jgi:UDP-N-acetylglucosamine 1-carboxyvinyltransferase
MGATIRLDAGYVEATAPQGLKGATIVFPFPSVGATENLLMAAALADGLTVLANAAREPEISNLAECLVAMGARIDGIGTDRLSIEGVRALHGAEVAIIPDRIETGSYACAAAITGGAVHLRHGRLANLGAVVRTLAEAGVEITEEGDGLAVRRLNGLHGIDFLTEPYPGFPTDMQAQVMALMCVADGASMITENIFEDRFGHAAELRRMGANIKVHGASAIVRGTPGGLSGAPVMASDLRASFGLIVAGLAARGVTTVNRVYHLDRGYEAAEEKLAACGADIERIPG